MNLKSDNESVPCNNPKIFNLLTQILDIWSILILIWLVVLYNLKMQ
jgi:hypothetical protein